MKFNFDIECTPDEARRFLGLPDVLPLQERMMKELENRMAENIRSMDPESFIKSWFPGGNSLQGFQDMQKMFWSQMGVPMTGEDDKKTAKK
jgi:hypothetical protein